MIADLLTIVIRYSQDKNLLKLRLVNKKLKNIVYKFGKLKKEIWTSFVKTCEYVCYFCYCCTRICKKCKLCLWLHDADDNFIKKYKNNIYDLVISSNDDNITDSSIKYLKNLVKLDIHGRHNKITDLSIKKLKNLTSLDLSCNNSITDLGIKGLKYLTELDLNHNKKITYAGIKDLKKIVKSDMRNSLMKEEDVKDLINKHTGIMFYG